MKFLVSCINKKIPNDQIYLLEVDIARNRARPIKLSHYSFPKQITGIATLVKYKDSIFFMTDGCLGGLLNTNLEISQTLRVSAINAHSAVVVDNFIYLTSTGNDSVIKVDIEKNSFLREWGDSLQDNEHINSIAYDGKDLFVTAFGSRSRYWHSARNGYIMNLSTGEKLIEGLSQPHSLVWFDNDLFFCNSATSEIKSLQDRTSIKIPGVYVRGLCLSEKYLAVAFSKGRVTSKSTGDSLVTNFTDKGTPIGISGIALFERASRLCDYSLIKKINLSKYSDELYDILPLDNFNQTIPFKMRDMYERKFKNSIINLLKK